MKKTSRDVCISRQICEPAAKKKASIVKLSGFRSKLCNWSESRQYTSVRGFFTFHKEQTLLFRQRLYWWNGSPWIIFWPGSYWGPQIKRWNDIHHGILELSAAIWIFPIFPNWQRMKRGQKNPQPRRRGHTITEMDLRPSAFGTRPHLRIPPISRPRSFCANC